MMTGRPAELRPLSDAECWALLRTRGVGRLASSRERVEVAVLNYALEENRIIFRRANEEAADLLRGAEVAFEVDGVDEVRRTGWSVVVHGVVVELDSDEVVRDGLDRLVEAWAPGTHDRWFLIRATDISGRWVKAEDTTGRGRERGYL